jgi:hypothetical protein
MPPSCPSLAKDVHQWKCDETCGYTNTGACARQDESSRLEQITTSLAVRSQPASTCLPVSAIWVSCPRTRPQSPNARGEEPSPQSREIQHEPLRYPGLRVQDRSLHPRHASLDSLLFPVKRLDLCEKGELHAYVFPLLFGQAPQQGNVSRKGRYSFIVVNDLDRGVFGIH